MGSTGTEISGEEVLEKHESLDGAFDARVIALGVPEFTMKNGIIDAMWIEKDVNIAKEGVELVPEGLGYLSGVVRKRALQRVPQLGNVALHGADIADLFWRDAEDVGRVSEAVVWRRCSVGGFVDCDKTQRGRAPRLACLELVIGRLGTLGARIAIKDAGGDGFAQVCQWPITQNAQRSQILGPNERVAKRDDGARNCLVVVAAAAITGASGTHA